jgi:hypothetical protein
MSIRTCTKCNETKELNANNFCKSKRYVGGLTRRCRICANKYRNIWALIDRTENMEESRAYEFGREMKKYGTTVEWYRDRLLEQSGTCAICKHLSHHHGTIQRLQVDHNHDCCDLRTKSCGKCLRGLLCADCNILLSYFEKLLKQTTSIVPKWDTWLEHALLYLTKYGSR